MEEFTMTTVSPHETPQGPGSGGCPSISILWIPEIHNPQPLNAHGLVFEGLSFELWRQALCHHLLNGLCARQQAPTCLVTAGSYSASQLLHTVSSSLYDLAFQISFPLPLLREICNALGLHMAGRDERDFLLSGLEVQSILAANTAGMSCTSSFLGLNIMRKPALLALAASHGISCAGSVDDLRGILWQHFIKGECAFLPDLQAACQDIQTEYTIDPGDADTMQAQLLSAVGPKASQVLLLKLLNVYEVAHDPAMSVT
ncbi:hypothetical protein L208DRAFT_1380472 [Tricholoma matsutake]|nr:hypothetical protein L208DRAFT_1380472 [Tricholoma matsutake 945]